MSKQENNNDKENKDYEILLFFQNFVPNPKK